MSTDLALQTAKMIVFGLDQARRASSRDNPVHEVEMIAAGIADVVAELELQIKVRDEELATLKAIHYPPGKRVKQKLRNDRVRQLAQSGLSYREICDRVGFRSPSTVHRILKTGKDANP